MKQKVDFNKCPELDDELKSWSLFQPCLPEVFFSEQRSYEEFIYALSNLKNLNPDDNTVVEYGFSEDEIKIITECYKDDGWNLENIIDDVKAAREHADKENSYINNVVRDWTKYKVPAINSKEHYEMRSYAILRYIKTISETQEIIYTSKEVCRTPFVICGVSEPLKGDTLYYKVRYATYNGEIKEIWASQGELLSRKELKNLFLSKGINCPENDLLSETIDYISRSISEFGIGLKKEYSAKQNGWNSDKSIFVLGDRAITANGTEPILSVGNGKGFPELDKKGSLNEWVSGVLPFLEYDLIRFKFYDIFTAPLKAVLGVESHITDHYGNTSCGKTFSYWVALSGIGEPEGLTIGAKSTAKGILVHIRDFSDLPILIDESSDAGDHLSDLVYPLTSNKGRVKSTVDGQRDGGEEYHTSTMFTGERPIRDCLTNSGQQYRVNELDDTLPDLPTKEINRIKNVIRENHGHIIEPFLKKMFEWKESGRLQDVFDGSFDSLQDTVSNIEGRSKSIFACIMTAGCILEDVFNEVGIPQKNTVKIVKKYFEKCILDKPVELEYIRALRIVLDWVHSDFGRFAEAERVEIPVARDVRNTLDAYNKTSETVECITQHDRNKRYGYIDENYIDLIGAEFTKKMKDEKFSPSKIKEDWWNQGIIDSNDPKRKGTFRFKRDGKLIVGVRIFREIAEELAGVSFEEDTSEPIPQDEKIKLIMKVLRFLTEIKGEADINLIRQLTEISDIDSLLHILTVNGKIMKINQTAYKSI